MLVTQYNSNELDALMDFFFGSCSLTRGMGVGGSSALCIGLATPYLGRHIDVAITIAL